MSGRRGRPPGARPPSEKDLKTHVQQFSFDTFKSHGNHKSNAHLFKVYELQEKERIHACMLFGGLDDQDPNGLVDKDCKNAGDLNVPVAILVTATANMKKICLL